MGWTVQRREPGLGGQEPGQRRRREQRTEVEAFLEALDEDDDVQTLYVGLAD